MRTYRRETAHRQDRLPFALEDSCLYLSVGFSDLKRTSQRLDLMPDSSDMLESRKSLAQKCWHCYLTLVKVLISPPTSLWY